MKRSLRSWLWRVSIHQEVDEEIAFHIEMRTRELVERSIDRNTARGIVLSQLAISDSSNGPVKTLAGSGIGRCA